MVYAKNATELSEKSFLKSRIAAAAAAVLFCLFLVFSFAFLGTEAGHDCSGKECVVCVEMEARISLLQGVLTAGAALAAGWYFKFFVFKNILVLPAVQGGLQTLISQKVKLTS